MSGSLTGGIDASIPLQAGKGIPPMQNPLTSLGQFATIQNALNQNKLFPGQMQLQGQAINKGALDLSQQHNTAAASWMAPFLALPPEQQTRAALTDMAARGEAAGIATGGFMNSVAGVNGADGAAFGAGVAPHIVARAQPSEKAVGAISPSGSVMDQGGRYQPMLTPAPGMPGQGVPVESDRAITKGYTPGEQLGGIQRPATAADVAANPSLTLGQTLTVPQTTLPATAGYNPGVGGARIPAGALGPGGYSAPRRPLDQLGAPYRPPGAPAPGAPPSMPGGRLMKGPGGSFMVPADKVAVFQQNGYR